MRSRRPTWQTTPKHCSGRIATYTVVAEQGLHFVESARDTLDRCDEKLIPIRCLPFLHPGGRHEAGHQTDIYLAFQYEELSSINDKRRTKATRTFPPF